MTMATTSVLLLTMLFSLSGRAVTKVERTCGPTLLLVHVCMLSNKICLNQSVFPVSLHIMLLNVFGISVSVLVHYFTSRKENLYMARMVDPLYFLI